MYEELFHMDELLLSKKDRDLLLSYAKLLFKGLNRQRLTGESSIENIIRRQVLDSVALLRFTGIPEKGLIDLGTGGGLPGIPLKICRREINLTLMEAKQKRVAFLKETVSLLGLEKVTYLCGRAEEFGQDPAYRESAPALVCKAVAETRVLAELALPLICLGGSAYFYKGPRGREEAKNAEAVIISLGGILAESWDYRLPGGEERTIIQVVKKKKTAARYPRRAGVPERKPLQIEGAVRA